ncbi:MAG: IS1634 family transposase [Phycisphaerae bacterium]
MVKVLGSLEVVRAYCRRLNLAETVDELCPMRAVEDGLSHGQVIEALIANRLTSPLPLYEIEEWARHFAVEEVFGIRPERLNDDRIGRALEALAPVVDTVRGAVGVQAINEFDLDASKFHWDLTSCTFEGVYEDQNEELPTVEYGHSSNKADTGKKQIRLGIATLQDGAIPAWQDVLSGNTSDVTTVVDTMNNLREQLQVSNFLMIGDSKLLSYKNMFAIHQANNRFLGPLSARPELEKEFLALDAATWPQLDYVSQRERKKPPEERIQYWGTELDWELKDPQTGELVTFRKLFILSSEERDACRKNRKRQMERAQRELETMRSGIRNRRYYTTREQILEKVDKVLTQRNVKRFFTPVVYEVDGRLRFQLRRNKRALREAEALDGYYVLCTNLSTQEADLLEAFTDYKAQSEVEKRFSNVKGPLRVRPVFLKNNDRILALVTVILLALTVFCLLEREVRRNLPDDEGMMAGLLPENRRARPTGRNILRKLSTQVLILSTIDGQPYTQRGPINDVQKRLLELLGVSHMKFG